MYTVLANPTYVRTQPASPASVAPTPPSTSSVMKKQSTFVPASSMPLSIPNPLALHLWHPPLPLTSLVQKLSLYHPSCETSPSTIPRAKPLPLPSLVQKLSLYHPLCKNSPSPIPRAKPLPLPSLVQNLSLYHPSCETSPSTIPGAR